ncbi:MAG: hypothetical protein M3R47_14465 [Chloroflexota bacterium]|nr:hypothetical protein [Chloroflexota bacterium]
MDALASRGFSKVDAACGYATRWYLREEINVKLFSLSALISVSDLAMWFLVIAE